MQYRSDKYGNKLSILGYGCMRFSQTVGGTDIKKTEKEILAAIEAGVNYFDTAYVYPGSEAALGEILERNGKRDQVNIATKLPHYLMKSVEDVEKCFAEELKRLRTDHVDYYLMHMLPNIVTWERLVGLGIADWLEEQKRKGTIRQVGFSYHGSSDDFIKLVDAYDWDFCQVQYNYLDVNSQAGITGVKHANAKGLPIIIMEPLRGGRLAKHLPKDAAKVFEHYKVKHSPAEWAFRWLWNQPEITVVLSGMNSLDMVKENTNAAATALAGDFTEDEYQLFDKVVEQINKKMKVGCTGCRYCMPCPKSVDIPGAFAAYNRYYADSKLWATVDYLNCTTLRKDPTTVSNCVKCGKCETHCPQGIEIRKELENVRKTMEGPLYKIVSFFVKKKMKY